MNNSKVVQAFLNNTSSKTLHLSSDGTKLFSYSTCIAEWDEECLLINDTSYSRTTKQHLNLLYKNVVNDRITLHGVRNYIHVVHLDEVPIGTYSLKYFNKHIWKQHLTM